MKYPRGLREKFWILSDSIFFWGDCVLIIPRQCECPFLLTGCIDILKIIPWIFFKKKRKNCTTIQENCIISSYRNSIISDLYFFGWEGYLRNFDLQYKEKRGRHVYKGTFVVSNQASGTRWLSLSGLALSLSLSPIWTNSQLSNKINIRKAQRFFKRI